MSLVIQQDKKEYPLCPSGLYEAVCVDIVDLGNIEGKFGVKHKLSILFEIHEEDPDGNRYIVGRRFTWSLHEKSHLRQSLENWRDRKFTPFELQDGFNLESLLGVSAILYISHNETDKKTYANITSILPPERGENGSPNWSATEPSGDYTRVINREGYKEPEKHAESVNGERDD